MTTVCPQNRNIKSLIRHECDLPDKILTFNSIFPAKFIKTHFSHFVAHVGHFLVTSRGNYLEHTIFYVNCVQYYWVPRLFVQSLSMRNSIHVAFGDHIILQIPQTIDDYQPVMTRCTEKTPTISRNIIFIDIRLYDLTRGISYFKSPC